MDAVTLSWANLGMQAAPLLILTVTGLAALFVRPQYRLHTIQLGLIGAVGALALAYVQWSQLEEALPQALLFFDHLGLTGGMIVTVALALTFGIAPVYLRARQLPMAEFVALLLFAVVGMWCMMATHHLAMIFVGIETLSLASYVLAAYHRSEGRSLEAGLKYFLLGSVAAAFLLFGMAFVYGATGTLDLLAMPLTAAGLPTAAALYARIGVTCLLVGFAFKVAAVPFQFWTPDVYCGAPLPVTAFFATAVKTGAFVALWRVMAALLPVAGGAGTDVLWWLAVATMTIGNLAALVQEDMKRMLAYSSIAHAGYAAIALVILPHDAAGSLSSLLLYLFSYTVMTIGAFGVLSVLSPGDEEVTDLGAVSGLAQRRPGLAALFSVFLLSLAGMPPTLGFFGKYYLFQAAVGAGQVPLVIVAVLNSVLAVGYYARPIVVMYFRSHPSPQAAATPAVWTMGLRVVLLVAVLTVLIGGLFPSTLLQLVTNAAR